jgi:hypothetical protein
MLIGKPLDGFHQRPEVGSVFMMLSGPALEALTKGIIIFEKPEDVQGDLKNSTKLYNWKGSGHKLRKLF